MENIEKILTSILESFEKLDSLSKRKKAQPTASTEVPSLDDKGLEILEEKLEDLEDSLDFLEEKEDLISEIIKVIVNEYETLDLEKKELILGYIKSSHTGAIDPDIRHLAGEIGREDLLSLAREAHVGLESFNTKIAEEMVAVKETMFVEEEKSDVIKKEIFVRKQNTDDEEKEFDENRREFDAEVEKLGILIEEIELALSEEEQMETLGKLRDFINQQTKDFT